MWEKHLSRPKLLYSTTSPLSGVINVWQQGRERTLEVGGYSQSVNLDAYGLERRVWGKIAEGASARVASKPDCALILGFGGGTVAHLLAAKFPGIQIDGVEIDPAIIAAGQRFFGLGEIPGLNIITADAIYVCLHPERYDLSAAKYPLIVFDAYLGDQVSHDSTSGETLQSIAEMLSPGGIAVFNWLSKRNLSGFRSELEHIFGNVEEVSVVYGPGLPPGNVLFFCS